MLGTIISDYHIVKKLGEGGMGEVYLGKHIKNNSYVAIKTLKNEFINNGEVKLRFKREAMAMMKLRQFTNKQDSNQTHSNIVQIIDYFEQDSGKSIMILEYVPGINLKAFVKQNLNKLEPQVILSVFIQILSAINYAHSKKIIHRDIKPSNIIINDKGHVKVLDFGIAKFADSPDLDLTKFGDRLGAVPFMSPEQIKGHPIDKKTDIYSLGILLYQLCTGKNPYEGITNEFVISEKICNEPIPKIDSVRPDLSGIFGLAIAKATQKDPKARFQNCEEFQFFVLNQGVQKPKNSKLLWIGSSIGIGVFLMALAIFGAIHLSKNLSSHGQNAAAGNRTGKSSAPTRSTGNENSKISAKPQSSTKPYPRLTVDKVTGPTNTEFRFDAAGSTDWETPGEKLQVRWDWNNDGTWDTDYSTLKIVKHQFALAGTFTVNMEVKDETGLTSNAYQVIQVTEAAKSRSSDLDARKSDIPDGTRQTELGQDNNFGDVHNFQPGPIKTIRIEENIYYVGQVKNDSIPDGIGTLEFRKRGDKIKARWSMGKCMDREEKNLIDPETQKTFCMISFYGLDIDVCISRYKLATTK